MARKYRGKQACCTCFNMFTGKNNEDCDPCTVCYREEYYSETNIQCSECLEKDCKYREYEYNK